MLIVAYKGQLEGALKSGLTEMAIAVDPWSVYFSFLFPCLSFECPTRIKKRAGGRPTGPPTSFHSVLTFEMMHQHDIDYIDQWVGFRASCEATGRAVID
jgi:hypothetical protein